jgi:2,4-dienoyl-CoA reductase-like NADH-dependent reductase (Old Yellow Enzyme family)/thioredoxin reductase
MAKQRQKVFTPIKIGTMTVKNRIAMAATLHEMCYNGYPTEAFLAIFDTYSKSGAGLIIVGGASIDNTVAGGGFSNQLYAGDDECLFGLGRIAEVIKVNGAKSCQQLFHPGRAASMRLVKEGITDVQAWSASSSQPWMLSPKLNITKVNGTWKVESVLEPVPVKEIPVDEIEEVVKKHVEAALRVKRAGFDSLNLHYANATLLMDFMSPYTNQRTDAYGGDWDKRMRFPMELIQAVKAAVGKGYPVTVRIPVHQGVGEAGIQFEDVLHHIVPRLEEAGFDAIDLSAGIIDRTPHVIMPPMYEPRGLLLQYSEEVKKITKLPVIVAGRLCDPRMIIKAVETDRCDIAAISRPLMADPLMPRKMMEGRLDDVRMCTACCYCFSEAGWGKNCALNPDLSRELIMPKIEPVKTPRNILVVGGGPGGMEAARILRERGHDVTLCEKKDYLGGTLFTASAAPLTREWRSYTKWHQRQIKKLGVKVHLGTEVTSDYIDTMRPDAVIVATGANPRRDIPGSEHSLVVTEDDALLKNCGVGNKVVVLGGAFWDVETAISLASEGRDVTLVRETPTIDMNKIGLLKGMSILTGKLQQSGVKPMFSTKVADIKANGVAVIDPDGNALFLEADTVVLSLGRASERSLADSLVDSDFDIHEIGDCVIPNNVAEAVYDARVVAAGI